MHSPENAVGRARRGDRAALEGLLERNFETVYRYVSSRLGRDHPELDDVMQDTLIAAMKSISRLRADDEAGFTKWLLTIATRKAMDCLRGRYAKPALALDQAVEDPSGQPDDIAASNAEAQQLRSAVLRLKPEQADVLVLKFVMGYENSDIALILHKRVGAVKSLQHRGLARLEKLLSEQAGGNND